MPQVSLIASAVRTQLWEDFFKSLEGTSVEFEVVFSGNSSKHHMILNSRYINENGYESFRNIKYIETSNIKPAQCYEIARRNATGETVVWVADDAEFPNDVIIKEYKYFKSKNT